MKGYFIKITILVVFSVISCNCVGYRNQVFYNNGNIEQAQDEVIDDFVKTYGKSKSKLITSENNSRGVFVINTENSSDENIFVFSILPKNNNNIALSIKDSLEKKPRKYFPNRYVVKGDLLFLWNDNKTPLKREVLDVMNRYHILDSVDVKRELGILPTDYEDNRTVLIDDGLKGVDYYVCKSDIRKYKKIVTNKAFGYYRAPKLKCPK